MLYINFAIKLWDQEFSHLKGFDDLDKNLVSKTAWINGFVYGKTFLLLSIEPKVLKIIKDREIQGIYDIEFQCGLNKSRAYPNL